jgi:hypothetical protein
MRLGKIICIVILLVGFTAQSQISLLDSIANYHYSYDYKSSRELFKSIDTSGFSSYHTAKYSYEKSRLDLNSGGDPVECYKSLLRAKKINPKDSLIQLFNINDELIYVYSSTTIKGSNRLELTVENCNIAQKTQNPRQRLFCNYYQLNEIYDRKKENKKGLRILNNSIAIAQNHNMPQNLGSLYFNLAVFHNEGEQLDSAFFYFRKILPEYQQTNNVMLKDLYNNIGMAHKNNKQPDSAIFYFKKALKLSKEYNTNLSKETILRNLADSYLDIKDYKNSAQVYQNTFAFRDSLTPVESAKSIEELETKYQTAEKDLEIAQRKAVNEKNRNTIIILSAIAAIILLFAILIYLNIRRKKQIAEKARELEKQRADNLFKEQELVTIDAMIAGQESERKRISEDLHDNLGSSLTTIKLYFENLRNQIKDPQAKTVFDKTEILLAETYENVRTMSHARGNGLLASRGLIPAVRELSQRINNSKELELEVHHYGLDQRLENSVELTIFRILQELTTNIVKHATATEASINITSHTDSLNIMIEDNGKGFSASPLPRRSGMGLSSIEKRVENMGGSFIVDSTPGRGTTITIDIPLS